jgi:hypothetical protein
MMQLNAEKERQFNDLKQQHVSVQSQILIIRLVPSIIRFLLDYKGNVG